MHRQVAQGFAIRYEEAEDRLAQVVSQRLLSQPSGRTSGGNSGRFARSSREGSAKEMLEKAFAINPMPTDADRDYLATQTGMTYKQVTVWFQNNRSRRVNALPKRNRQQSTTTTNNQHTVPPYSVTPPLQTGSSFTSLQEVEHHLRNPTDSPLAEHIDLPNTTTSRSLATPLPKLSKSGNLPVAQSNNDDLENNRQPAIVSRSPGGTPCAFAAGGALGGNADVDAKEAAKETSRRPIAPLRKNRLAGKKPAAPTSQPPRNDVPPALSCPTAALPAYLANTTYTDSPTQITPADILNRQNNQQRVPSNGSVNEVDLLLGRDVTQTASTSRAVSSSSSSMDNMLLLPLHTFTDRITSGSTVGEIELGLTDAGVTDAGAGMGKEAMLDAVPMFNFLPPTPSNAGFTSSTTSGTSSTIDQQYPPYNGALPGDSNYVPTANLQFDPIDFSTLFGFPTSSTYFPGGAGPADADAAAQNLLKDLDELDFGEFLCSPDALRRGSGFSAKADEGQAGGKAIEEAIMGKETEREVEGVAQPYFFEKMALDSFSEKEIDPVVLELLKSIMAANPTTSTNIVDPATHTYLESGTAAPLMLRSSSTASVQSESRRESPDLPSLNALAIDLSTLLHATNSNSNNGNTANISSRGSLCLQTTPSDVSDLAQFCVTPSDELVYTPLITPLERQTVPQDVDVDVDVDGKRDSLQLPSNAGNKEAVGDWSGLLDFGDMFEAFWSMVDDSPAPAPGSQAANRM
ncbi:hypothetical protein QFC22_001662 [Naganishia vaughanmartiniae]|uniref:Uncharacterized protein n=1 Tax=Naganishia vaughanmartiniae TaxID=1424756 RepID=A0ACC2XE98_9TREE|nr:hypothetical protein QFC22_001662 [Naganishia vaughanmartiniae]